MLPVCLVRVLFCWACCVGALVLRVASCCYCYVLALALFCICLRLFFYVFVLIAFVFCLLGSFCLLCSFVYCLLCYFRLCIVRVCITAASNVPGLCCALCFIMLLVL